VKLFIFDVDKTLLSVNSSFKYYFFLIRKKVFSKTSFLRVCIFFFRYKFLNLSPEELHSKIFKNFFKGRNRKEIFKYVDIFADILIFKFLNKKIFSILEKAKKNKNEILLLSNSPCFLIGAIANKLNIKNYKATFYTEDEFGKFIKISKMMGGDEKAKYAENFARNLKISKEDILVFTDSIWDIALLKIAKKGYVVNPNRKMISLAKKNSWEVL